MICLIYCVAVLHETSFFLEHRDSLRHSTENVSAMSMNQCCSLLVQNTPRKTNKLCLDWAQVETFGLFFSPKTTRDNPYNLTS